MTILTIFTASVPDAPEIEDTSWMEPSVLVGGSVVMPPVAYDLYMAFEPLHYAEAEFGFPLAQYCVAIASMFEVIDAAVRQGETEVIMDPATVPLAGIPWLGQFVGLSIQRHWSPELQRQQLNDRRGFRRGSPLGMARAAQTFLTGNKTVMLYERYTDDPWKLHVVTRIAETPDASLVLSALLSQKPAGIVMTHQTIDDETYDEAAALHATYNALSAAHPTYNSLGG